MISDNFIILPPHQCAADQFHWGYLFLRDFDVHVLWDDWFTCNLPLPSCKVFVTMY